MRSLGHARSCQGSERGKESFTRLEVEMLSLTQMDYVTVVERLVVLWLNRSSLIPMSTLLPPNIFLLSSPQYKALPQPSPLPGWSPLFSAHLIPPPVALQLLVEHLWPSPAACFLLWLLLPLTVCETWGEARISSRSSKACDFIQNGYLTLARAVLCNVQCNLFREGSHSISGRTGDRAQVYGSLGSHLSMLPRSYSGGFPMCFQRPVQHVNSCLASWKTQGQNTEQWQLFLVLLHLNNSLLVCKSCGCLSQGNSCSPKEPFQALHRNDSLNTNHRKTEGKTKWDLAGIGFLLTQFGLLPKLSAKENTIGSFRTAFVYHVSLGFNPNYPLNKILPAQHLYNPMCLTRKYLWNRSSV